jgi:hypothetical protein
MKPDPLRQIQQQLTELEKKMPLEVEKRQLLFKNIYQPQYPESIFS